MKLYHVETQEDYDALMVELEKEGCVWEDDTKPTHNKNNNNNWNDFKRDTVIKRSNQNRLVYMDKDYYENPYTTTPIEKYKAKTDEFEKWTKHAAEITKRWFAEGVPISKVNNDNVNNPEHYTAGGIETLDYIKAKVKDYPSYAAGNILKYVSRYEHKNGIEDLKKAQFYLNDLIEWMESD
ncbi:DUF3310 domain-containing protein [Listeria marthii]|uniref:DUF3310 domain-containing protein n=1 Tax=Listeria marthii TaxID=529731 RepID=UPI001628B5F9|nr:DUF3310 domain-containing protein [Listeria marthii]MBC2040766.1 DUF3310 domain-containing protein [Listeria marthii]